MADIVYTYGNSVYMTLFLRFLHQEQRRRTRLSRIALVKKGSDA